MGVGVGVSRVYLESVGVLWVWVCGGVVLWVCAPIGVQSVCVCVKWVYVGIACVCVCV
jgi:hypothetical protein